MNTRHFSTITKQLSVMAAQLDHDVRCENIGGRPIKDADRHCPKNLFVGLAAAMAVSLSLKGAYNANGSDPRQTQHVDRSVSAAVNAILALTRPSTEPQALMSATTELYNIVPIEERTDICVSLMYATLIPVGYADNYHLSAEPVRTLLQCITEMLINVLPKSCKVAAYNTDAILRIFDFITDDVPKRPDGMPAQPVEVPQPMIERVYATAVPYEQIGGTYIIAGTVVKHGGLILISKENMVPGEEYVDSDIHWLRIQ